MKPNFVKNVSTWGNHPIVNKLFKAEEDYHKIREFLDKITKLLRMVTEDVMEMPRWQMLCFLQGN